jgi:hypothetical protein
MFRVFNVLNLSKDGSESEKFIDIEEKGNLSRK